MYIMNNMNGRVIGLGNTVIHIFTLSFYDYKTLRPDNELFQMDYIVKHIKR